VRQGIRRWGCVTAVVGLTASAQVVLSSAIAEAATTSVACTGSNATDVSALVAAITAADGAAGPQVIALTPGCTISLGAVDNTTDGPTGLPVVSNAVTISGDRDTIRRSTAPHTPAFRLLDVAAGGRLSLSGLTLSNGAAALSGGAVSSHGPLQISGATIVGNRAGVNGGAVFAGSELVVSGSTVSANTAGSFGGGLFGSGTLTVSGTTVSANSAGLGGGGALADGLTAVSASSFLGNHGGSGGGGLLALSSSTLALNASTFSGNDATQGGGLAVNNAASVIDSTFGGNSATSGGGVYTNAGVVALVNDTVAGNHASGSGGGIVTTGSAVTTVTNSIVADNAVGNCGALPSSPAHVTDGGHNLENGTTCAFTREAVIAEPALGALQDNGGPTATMAITAASPAYRRGDPAACSAAHPAGAGGVDQRGSARKTAGACDIGAFEAAATATPTPGPSGVAGLTTTVPVPGTGATPDGPDGTVIAILVILAGVILLSLALAPARSDRRRRRGTHSDW
jgi:hypothetical protein